MNKRTYRLAAHLGLRSAVEYRTNYVVGLISVIFPLLIQFSLWSAAFGQREAGAVILGYTYPQMLLYSLTATMSARFLSTDVHTRIAEEIKGGQLNRYLVQPIVYPAYRLSVFLGEKVMHFIVNAIILTAGLVFMSVTGLVHVETANILLYLADIPLAMMLNFLMFLCISFLSFWLIEVSRVFGVISILLTIFSGAILPLDVFGETAVHILQNFPFFYTSYFLTNILSGRLAITQIGQSVLIQLGWIALLTALAALLWYRGKRRYEGVGG